MDPITDLFNRIKNAQAVNQPAVQMPMSKLRLQILEMLKGENFIESVEKKGRGSRKILEVILKYENNIPALSGFKRISKPGQRIYLKKDKILRLKRRGGLVMVSTSQGLMSDKGARKNGLGGEALVEVW